MPVDDWEHFLIWEAVIERFSAMRAVAEKERDSRRDAKRKAEELLELHRGKATGAG